MNNSRQLVNKFVMMFAVSVLFALLTARASAEFLYTVEATYEDGGEFNFVIDHSLIYTPPYTPPEFLVEGGPLLNTADLVGSSLDPFGPIFYEYRLDRQGDTTNYDASFTFEYQLSDIGLPEISLSFYSDGYYCYEYVEGDCAAWGFPNALVPIAALSVITPFSVVPIPAAAWLFGFALLGLGAVKRRQQK